MSQEIKDECLVQQTWFQLYDLIPHVNLVQIQLKWLTCCYKINAKVVIIKIISHEHGEKLEAEE